MTKVYSANVLETVKNQLDIGQADTPTQKAAKLVATTTAKVGIALLAASEWCLYNAGSKVLKNPAELNRQANEAAAVLVKARRALNRPYAPQVRIVETRGFLCKNKKEEIIEGPTLTELAASGAKEAIQHPIDFAQKSPKAVSSALAFSAAAIALYYLSPNLSSIDLSSPAEPANIPDPKTPILESIIPPESVVAPSLYETGLKVSPHVATILFGPCLAYPSIKKCSTFNTSSPLNTSTKSIGSKEDLKSTRGKDVSKTPISPKDNNSKKIEAQTINKPTLVYKDDEGDLLKADEEGPILNDELHYTLVNEDGIDKKDPKGRVVYKSSSSGRLLVKIGSKSYMQKNRELLPKITIFENDVKHKFPCVAVNYTFVLANEYNEPKKVKDHYLSVTSNLDQIVLNANFRRKTVARSLYIRMLGPDDFELTNHLFKPILSNGHPIKVDIRGNLLPLRNKKEFFRSEKKDNFKDIDEDFKGIVTIEKEENRNPSQQPSNPSVEEIKGPSVEKTTKGEGVIIPAKQEKEIGTSITQMEALNLEHRNENFNDSDKEMKKN